MIHRLLIGLAGSEAMPAVIHHGIELATPARARVDLLSVAELADDHGVIWARTGSLALARRSAWRDRSARRQSIRQGLEEIERRCRQAGLRCRELPEAKEPWQALQEASRFVDMLVLATTGLAGSSEDDPIEHLEALVHHGVRPLLCCPAQHRPVERVLIGLSASLASARSLRRFLFCGPWPEAEVHLCHVGDGQAGAELLRSAAAYCRDHGRRVAEPLQRKGEPGAVLLAVARERDCGALVLGESSKALVRRRLIGEVSDRVLRQATLACLLI